LLTIGFAEGGVPIGGVLVSEDGTVLGRGHNMRFQKASAILHGEMAALENAGRLEGKAYKNCTMYTTLSPCSMCTGACLLYGVKRVVLGENANFVGAEDWLRAKGVEVVNMDNQECKDLMAKFIKERPEDWFEDIGE
jgi:creatinine deaminase